MVPNSYLFCFLTSSGSRYTIMEKRIKEFVKIAIAGNSVASTKQIKALNE
jgi:hypothetical protein